MNDKTLNLLKRSAGIALVSSSLAAAMPSLATENPFVIEDLGHGYQVQLAEGKCGEGRCGEAGEEDKDTEGKCGEGRCGG